MTPTIKRLEDFILYHFALLCRHEPKIKKEVLEVNERNYKKMEYAPKDTYFASRLKK